MNRKEYYEFHESAEDLRRANAPEQGIINFDPSTEAADETEEERLRLMDEPGPSEKQEPENAPFPEGIWINPEHPLKTTFCQKCHRITPIKEIRDGECPECQPRHRRN